MSGVTKEQVGAVVDVIRALADTIRELGSVPNGHLYAQVMEVLDLPTYERAIAMLKRAGLVAESGHLLTWACPPALESKAVAS